MRIGQGFDVHAFGNGDHITLGGVRIAFDKGLVAHSDGDVLIHAVCDALLGAAALGDIGKHFPDSDPRYRGADSRLLLKDVVELLTQAGFHIVNTDVTVIAQAPRLAAHIERMRENLAQDTALGVDQVSVKATTTEGLGYCGRGEGIAAHAVALIDTIT